MYGKGYLKNGEAEDAIIKTFCERNGLNSLDEIILDDIEIERMSGDFSGIYRKSARAIFFPFKFNDDVVKEVKRRAGGKCKICEKEADTIDHNRPVSNYFNEEGYLKSRVGRRTWYNDINNLQLLCRSCNSRKGGEPFDSDKVKQCIQSGLV